MNENEEEKLCECCGKFPATHQGQEDELLCNECHEKGVIQCKDCSWNLFIPDETNVGFFLRRCSECQEVYLNDNLSDDNFENNSENSNDSGVSVH